MLRSALFLLLAAAMLPLSGFGVFVYPLLLIALTFAFDRRAVTTLGLRAVPFAIYGLAAGAAMFAVCLFAVKMITGGTIEFRTPMLVAMLGSVLAEELVFRGYAFKRLADQRKWTAIILFAVLFGVYHWYTGNLWTNPQAMALALIGTGLAHVFFALAMLRSGTLWLPIGLHLGWNLFDAATQVSGSTFLPGFAAAMTMLLVAIAALVAIPPRAQPLPAASP